MSFGDDTEGRKLPKAVDLLQNKINRRGTSKNNDHSGVMSFQYCDYTLPLDLLENSRCWWSGHHQRGVLRELDQQSFHAHHSSKQSTRLFIQQFTFSQPSPFGTRGYFFWLMDDVFLKWVNALYLYNAGRCVLIRSVLMWSQQRAPGRFGEKSVGLPVLTAGIHQLQKVIGTNDEQPVAWPIIANAHILFFFLLQTLLTRKTRWGKKFERHETVLRWNYAWKVRDRGWGFIAKCFLVQITRFGWALLYFLRVCMCTAAQCAYANPCGHKWRVVF